MQTPITTKTYIHNLYPDERGRFGSFGGKFVPESLMLALAELDAAYERAINDTGVQADLNAQLSSFVVRPTTLNSVPRFSQLLAPGVNHYLKRHTLTNTP